MTALASRKNQTMDIVFLILLMGLSALLFADAFYSASIIWFGNEIYNHCALVLPASAYLIWERRHEIQWHQAKSSKLALLFIFAQLLLFLLGLAGDIQLFQHAALFAFIPTLLWFVLGDKIAWQLKFPLMFILFAIPIGEELVPFLQEITADISVYMLSISGIPLFRSGLFIEIPQGKFLVAEACSGVSFLIASIVIGNLYAYMNLKTMRRRIFFVLLSVLVPILANALRVYGIILVGYWSDMKHAVGADHLIYGWFFFAFVIVMLLAIGEWIRARERKALSNKHSIDGLNKSDNLDASSVSARRFGIHLSIAGTIVLSMLLILSLWQSFRMQNLEAASSSYPQFDILADFEGRGDFVEPLSTAQINSLEWSPKFRGVSDELQQSYSLGTETFDLYYAYFDGSDGELVSSLHRLYQQERWTLTARERIEISDKQMLQENISSSIGIKRKVYYAYIVDGYWTVSRKEAKLLEVLQTLQGKRSQGAIIALSFIEDDSDAENSGHIEALRYVSEYLQTHFVSR